METNLNLKQNQSTNCQQKLNQTKRNLDQSQRLSKRRNTPHPEKQKILKPRKPHLFGAKVGVLGVGGMPAGVGVGTGIGPWIGIGAGEGTLLGLAIGTGTRTGADETGKGTGIGIGNGTGTGTGKGSETGVAVGARTGADETGTGGMPYEAMVNRS